ncbi:MAG: hypothetical protein E6Z50_08205, partial [Anaerococcus vaginalis]|nr:hypothetical protein [Anaerococcus vaginalis]MDU5825039.1 hypothetical protein [Anaerococcus vaginalis]
MKGGDWIDHIRNGKFYFSLVGWFDIIFCKKILFRKQVNKKTVVATYCLFFVVIPHFSHPYSLKLIKGFLTRVFFSYLNYITKDLFFKANDFHLFI